MDIPQELPDILSRDPEVMGGDVCFTGTRIPVVVLLDNVAAGTPMDEFYGSNPSLALDMVRPVLDWKCRKAREALGLELAV